MSCDIIIPVWNLKDYTQQCVESVIKNTEYPYRLIIIDNGSEKETKKYLEDLKKDPRLPGYTLIRNEENTGFPKAANQGIAVSNAAYLCILNNDTEVHKGWLEEMIKVAEGVPMIGIVNPSSNNLGQSKPLEGFSGKWIEMAACTGFCMLIRREVIDKVGMFDEIYTPGNFEDRDLSKKAVKAGYKCIMAKGAYVYHRQNTSFKKRKDRDSKFKRNRDIFNEKWGSTKRAVYIIAGSDSDSIKTSVSEFLKQGDWVWIILKKGSKKIEIQEHASLSIFKLGKIGFIIKVIWRVLKRKKRFDKVITDSRFLRRFFRIFGYSTTQV